MQEPHKKDVMVTFITGIKYRLSGLASNASIHALERSGRTHKSPKLPLGSAQQHVKKLKKDLPFVSIKLKTSIERKI